MNDITGKELEILHKVAFVQRNGNLPYLWTGVVMGFSKQMVSVKYTDRFTKKEVESSRKPHNLVIIKN